MIVSTGASDIDSLFERIIGVLQGSFPERLRACYVLGSYADGTSVPGSDVDLVLLVKDRFRSGEREAMLGRIAEVSSPVRLDLTLSDEAPGGRARFTPILKLGSLLVWGEDVRDRIELPPHDEYLRDVIRSGYGSWGSFAEWRHRPIRRTIRTEAASSTGTTPCVSARGTHRKPSAG